MHNRQWWGLSVEPAPTDGWDPPVLYGDRNVHKHPDLPITFWKVKNHTRSLERRRSWYIAQPLNTSDVLDPLLDVKKHARSPQRGRIQTLRNRLLVGTFLTFQKAKKHGRSLKLGWIRTLCNRSYLGLCKPPPKLTNTRKVSSTGVHPNLFYNRSICWTLQAASWLKAKDIFVCLNWRDVFAPDVQARGCTHVSKCPVFGAGALILAGMVLYNMRAVCNVHQEVWYRSDIGFCVDYMSYRCDAKELSTTF